MVVQNIIERIHQTHKTENSDITLQSNNGKVHTTRLFLASWSKFWKEVLLGLDNGEEIVVFEHRKGQYFRSSGKH